MTTHGIKTSKGFKIYPYPLPEGVRYVKDAAVWKRTSKVLFRTAAENLAKSLGGGEVILLPNYAVIYLPSHCCEVILWAK